MIDRILRALHSPAPQSLFVVNRALNNNNDMNNNNENNIGTMLSSPTVDEQERVETVFRSLRYLIKHRGPDGGTQRQKQEGLPIQLVQTVKHPNNQFKTRRGTTARQATQTDRISATQLML